MRNLILVLLLILSIHAIGQNIVSSTVAWSTSKTFNVNSGEMTPVANQLISYRQDSVNWKDASGNLKYSFLVNEVTGAWTDITASGEVIYEVSSGGYKGNIYFTRTAAGILIRIFLLTATDPVIYELTVNSTQVL
jgi:hypothetical protein